MERIETIQHRFWQRVTFNADEKMDLEPLLVLPADFTGTFCHVPWQTGPRNMSFFQYKRLAYKLLGKYLKDWYFKKELNVEPSCPCRNKIMEDKTMTIMRRSDSYFPSLLDNFLSRDLFDWGSSNFSSTNTTLPAVNVIENEDAYEIEVAAPGMSKDDFTVKLENNLLTISSEKKGEKKEKKKGQFTRREFSYQSFQRSFTVPENEVDGKKISASYFDGVLCISLPKREEVKPKPAREIKIL